MHAFQKETSQIISILEEANQKITQIINPEIAFLKGKIQGDIMRHANALRLQSGQHITGVETPAAPKPLTKMFGRDVTPKPRVVKDVNKPFLEGPNEVEEKELKLKVDELYPKFLITEADHLIDSLTDIEIRGVAKKAGIPVTETEPAKIDSKFITQIKTAIKKKAEIENIGKR